MIRANALKILETQLSHLLKCNYDNLMENQIITLEDGTTCPLTSLEDIEAMKSVAISQRGSAKDFVDLYFILKKSRHHFDDILKLVIKKYNLDTTYEYQLKTSLSILRTRKKRLVI